MSPLNLVEATIDDLQASLTSGNITSVELVARYLRRISAYDCRGISLNSIPKLNTHVFDEAAASDDRRAAGQQVRPLEGIPYTVKDSFSVRDMTVACGSPAFEKLVASNDAFTVGAIRNAGGVLLGRTNMPPMAYGGMQRGIYGRSESPYNPHYLAAAFWSGSSNGSAVSTAASLSAFGMGEETVSSGRAPASNNALVAYTPSRGWISIRGNWPLYPTCDVVVPHTRCMRDMLRLLEVITVDDPLTEGDFWRDQPYIKLEQPWRTGHRSLRDIEQCTSLVGLRIAVPHMYVGGPAPTGATPVTTSSEVLELWEQARQDLESLGAEVIIVPDFPVVTAYEHPELLPEGCSQLPDDWHASERGPLIAHSWDQFLRRNGDPKFPDLFSVDPFGIYPESFRTAAELTVIDRSNAIRYAQLANFIAQAPLYETPRLAQALAALEGLRKCLLEDWLDSIGCHFVAFPAAGDVGSADADIDEKAAAYARRNGVFYSNGNRALRHLGVPTVSIPMGIMKYKRMPANITFAGKAYDDANLLAYGHAYEKKTQKREAPIHTPALPTDVIDLNQRGGMLGTPRPVLTVKQCLLEPDSSLGAQSRLFLEGTVAILESTSSANIPKLELTVNHETVPSEDIKIEPHGEGSSSGALFHFKATATTEQPVSRDKRSRSTAPVVRDSTIVTLLARSGENGRPSGWLGIV